ncbi:hypothetical protein [Pararcticibacter amylolyticus]|uniref:Uncharacterized protein n=1 Tax=Pararcticibacter amylolyticus TaxID=2173175 RepID=A0A2U2P926_9SPHI|nr:hypothetical protein [Pararcticibacter amylolyticus]PWG77870.1 hypothetical protein DDR33_25235 [Pararcticibacter amylolyticus]
MKIICVPKHDQALNRLEFDENIEGDLIEISITEQVHSKLENIGFFDSINRLAGSNIDNFEDESITDKKILQKLMDSDVLDEKRYDTLGLEVKKIKNLFEEALKYQTGIFFYF